MGRCCFSQDGRPHIKVKMRGDEEKKIPGAMKILFISRISRWVLYEGVVVTTVTCETETLGLK